MRQEMSNLSHFQAFIPDKNACIAVGMSGGVDSSVSAYLLKQAGYKVFGIFMKNWEELFDTGYCSVAEDLQDAKDICDAIGIKLHTVNFAQEYREKVFSLFLEEYKKGRTPNPDVLCNREIKFAQMLDYALDLGADFLATGHYARRLQWENTAALYKGMDKNKDQSYFLQQLTQNQLKRAIFPLGELEKTYVRKIAEEQKLSTFDKKDSTGICFIGERPFREFLEGFLPAQKGLIKTLDGEIIGEHFGLMFYTIGQRKGLGIGGIKNASDEPWFVAEKDLENNVLIVCQGDNDALYHRELSAENCSWLNENPLAGGKYFAQTRYRQADQICHISYPEKDNINKIKVIFEAPQRAITLGQYLAVYDEEGRCLGGGIISERNKIGR